MDGECVRVVYTCPRAHGARGLPLPLMAIGSVSVQNYKFVGVYVILLAEETQRIDIDRDVRVFTVVTPRVSWGTNISEIFVPRTGYVFLKDRETIVAVPVRNWRGCFQPMINVKNALLCYLGSFDHPIQLRGNHSFIQSWST